MSAVCRKAKLEDVEPLYQMIQGYAEKGIMPRSKKCWRNKSRNSWWPNPKET